MNSRLKKRAIPLLIVLIALLAAFAAAEIYARRFSAAGYFTPEIMRERSLQYDPAVFSRHVFTRKELTITNWEGREILYHINEQGYRGRDFEFTKPPGTTRIIFYGGSAVFDLNSYDDDWPHRVEAILKNSGFPRVEVINAGTPHHASFDSFGKLFAEGHLLDPDYVVFYNAWNDIKTFRSTEPLLRSLRPYDGKLDPRLTYRNFLDRKLCELSQVYSRLRYRYYDWRLEAGIEGKKPKGEFVSDFGEIGPKQFRLSAEMFVELARNIGAVPILMTEARLVTPDSSPLQQERVKYDFQLLTHEAVCRAFELCDEMIRSIAQEKQVYLIDASAQLTGQDSLFVDHVHFTVAGSKRIAQLVAAQLAPILREHERVPATTDDGAGSASSGGH